MKPVVIAKILQEALRASWNFSDDHWLHHPMNVKNQILILKWICISCQTDWGWQKVDNRSQNTTGRFLQFDVQKENLTILLNFRSLSFIADRSLFFTSISFFKITGRHWMKSIYSNIHSSVIVLQHFLYTEQLQPVVWLMVDAHTNRLICVFYMHIPNYTYIPNTHVKYS